MRHLISKAGTVAGYAVGVFAAIGGIGLVKANMSSQKVIDQIPKERIEIRSKQSQVTYFKELVSLFSQRDFLVIQILDDLGKGIFIAEYLSHGSQHEFIWTGHSKSLTLYVDLEVDVRPLLLVNGVPISTLDAITVYSEIHSEHKILPEL